jgi:uncharacterized membrane protein YedE/YeeE
MNMNQQLDNDGVAGKLWNPYLGGVALGLVLLASFLVLGHGIGASGAASRLGATALNAVAPEHVANSAYFSKYTEGGASPLNNWLVFGVIGVFLGGAVASMTGGRQKPGVVRGPRISVGMRLTLALTGGIIMGFAARLARGCTSGQALSGGALFSVGSWIFMLCVFGGGYALALVVRRQWQ